MRPHALQIIDSVRTLLAQTVLPEIATPYLQSQVGTAAMLLTLALDEIDGLVEALTGERHRTEELLRDAAGALQGRVGAQELAAAVSALADGGAAEALRISALLAIVEERRAMLGRVLEFCEGAPEFASLRGRIYDELRRQAQWEQQGSAFRRV